MINRLLSLPLLGVLHLTLLSAGEAVAASSSQSIDLAGELATELFVPSVSNPGAMCVGRYQLPDSATRAGKDANLRVAADSLTGNLDTGVVLSGAVAISQGALQITAPQAEIAADSSIRFSQGLQVQQPGVVMRGRQAQWLRGGMSGTAGRLHIERAEVVFGVSELRATAERLERGADGRLLIDGGEFTYCAPGDDGWRLSAQTLRLAPDTNQVVTRGTVLRVKSLPVLYLPYLRLPMRSGDQTEMRRQSGFLVPELGYGDEDGVSVAVPYYLNLAANLDATVQPKLISNRGAGLAAQVRWLTLKQSSQLQGSFLAGDDIYNGVMSRRRYDQFGGFDEFGAFAGADRWFGNFRHQGQFGALRTVADYSALSDRDYLRDLGADFDLARDRSFDSTNPMDLQRRVELYYQRNDFAIKLWHQSFQRLDQLPQPSYSRSPQLDITYARRLGAFWSVRALSSWVQFRRTTDDFFAPYALPTDVQDTNQGRSGERWHVQPELSFRRRWAAGFLRSAAGIKFTSYALRQDHQTEQPWVGDDTPQRQVGYLNIDGGLYLERKLSIRERGWLHTLEPRALYLRQSYSDQSALPLFDTTTILPGYSQLFRKERFVGLDRVGDANQLTLGVTTRMLSAQNGQEYASYSLGKIFYARKHRVGLLGNTLASDAPSSSVLASELSLRFAKYWQLDSQQIWHDETSRWQELGASLHYRDDQRRLLSVGARKRRASAEYLDEALEQLELSTIWPTSKQMSLMASWHYDLQRSRTVEGFVGLQYDDCCIRARFMLTQALRSSAYLPLRVAGSADYALRRNQGIAIEVTLKGLGGFGSNIDRMLRHGVRGYEVLDPAR